MTRRAPLAANLLQARSSGAAAFHMPGHKGGAGAAPDALALLGEEAFASDVSEVAGVFDYLHGPAGAMVEAQQAAADLFGADRTWFLVGGATAGNLAALWAVAGEGDEVLLTRGSHRSVLGGLVLSGATPVYLPPAFDHRLDGAFGCDVDGLAAALAAHPRAVAVHLTSPDYYGFASPLAAAAEVCHAAGVALVVDEAHGTHFALHRDLPPSALAAGADVVVHSPHKTLGSLTQSAMLHLRGDRVDAERVGAALALLQSSSPSALLTTSVDLAVAWAADPAGGGARLDEAVALAADARRRVAALPGLVLVDPSGPTAPVRAIDPTKLVVDVTGRRRTGFDAAAWLRAEGGVVPEFADLRRVVCSITLADDDATVGALVAGLAALPDGDVAPGPGAAVVEVYGTLPEVVCTPRRASQLRARPVPLDAAVGLVAAEAVIPYPPGIPLVAPGERIAPTTVDALVPLAAAGCRIVGPADRSLATLRCVDLDGPPAVGSGRAMIG